MRDCNVDVLSSQESLAGYHSALKWTSVGVNAGAQFEADPLYFCDFDEICFRGRKRGKLARRREQVDATLFRHLGAKNSCRSQFRCILITSNRQASLAVGSSLYGWLGTVVSRSRTRRCRICVRGRKQMKRNSRIFSFLVVSVLFLIPVTL